MNFADKGEKSIGAHSYTDKSNEKRKESRNAALAIERNRSDVKKVADELLEKQREMVRKAEAKSKDKTKTNSKSKTKTTESGTKRKSTDTSASSAKKTNTGVASSTGPSTSKSTSLSKSKQGAKSPGSLIGKRVAKYFGTECYFGTIREWYQGIDGLPLWAIWYDDDDKEDMDEKEVWEAIDMYKINKVRDTARN